MKRVFLVIVFILLAALLFFLIKSNQIVQQYFSKLGWQINKNDYVPGKIAPGKIVITFTDEAPYSEVIQAIEAENLNYENLFEMPAFEPYAFVSVPLEREQILADSLAQSELISKVIIESNNLKIQFVRGITKSEAEKVLKNEGLIMEEFHRSAYLLITVPVGEEKFYIDKFKKLPIVDVDQLRVVNKLLNIH